MTRRGALTQAERTFIGQRKAAGASLAQLAVDLDCERVTVRKWWRRQRAGQPAAPRGRPRQGILSTYPAELVQEAVELKQTHPHWGPANVKLQLKRDTRFGSMRLPSDARLVALFGARCPDAVQRRVKQAYPNQPVPKALAPHQRWQLDGKERVVLGQGRMVTILTVRDPVGGLMIASQAIDTTTPSGWRKVSLAEVQACLRQAFGEWGRPLELQTDHEPTYTGPAKTDCPSPFTLWLVGLGMTHVPSRDRRPTDQGAVERSHRTLAEMGWLDQRCADAPQLQVVLDECRRRYNYELPVRAADCQGRPPLVAHPHADHSGRPYHPAYEWDLFDLDRVDAYLAQFVWTRQVTAAGNVGFADEIYYLGRRYAHQTVSLRFQPGTRSLLCQSTDGTVLADWPVRNMDQADLIGYTPVDWSASLAWQLPLPLQGV